MQRFRMLLCDLTKLSALGGQKLLTRSKEYNFNQAAGVIAAGVERDAQQAV